MISAQKPSQDSSPPSTDSSASSDRGNDSTSRAAAVKRGRPSIEEAQRLPIRILEAGWEVLRESGFDAFTFDRVARHARIGKATIYSRFASKREFLEGLLRQKSEERRLSIMAVGNGQPLVESFCLRAVAVMAYLHSVDGRMMERLLDWCDQEFGGDGVNYRDAMFDRALEDIASELMHTAERQSVTIADVRLAARFWLEGLMGHARLIGANKPFDRIETEKWARAYSEFFFTGLRCNV
jgi:AcrR family transcriptional regulator